MGHSSLSKKVTLPALQKIFVNIYIYIYFFFFRIAWEFFTEKRRGFLVNFVWETKHENSSKNSGKFQSKIREEIRDKNSKNSGNFRSATFLTKKRVWKGVPGSLAPRCPNIREELRKNLFFSSFSILSESSVLDPVNR